MKKLIYGVVLAHCVGSSAAADCYVRAYSDVHLANNQTQMVSYIRLLFETDGDLVASAQVRFRDDTAAYESDFFSCMSAPWFDEGTLVCTSSNGEFITKDSGSAEMLIYSQGIEFAGHNGAAAKNVVDFGEVETIFKLSRVEKEICYR